MTAPRALATGPVSQENSLRVIAMGRVDRLHAFIGTVLSQADVPPLLAEYLWDIQHDLFAIGAELCIPGNKRISTAPVSWLELQLDELPEH
jgi:cob(I)alamin adenosyltransferase